MKGCCGLLMYSRNSSPAGYGASIDASRPTTKRTQRNEKGDDAERTSAIAGGRLPPRTTAAHTRLHELVSDRGVDVRFQKDAPLRSYETSATEKRVANGTRTRDHRDHNPGLYQLSYRHREER